MKDESMEMQHTGRVTAKEVAKIAGVSISAVSRTFTTGASVSQKTRSKVLKAASELGYQPNLLARSLMTNRTELIGLVLDNFDNPAYMEVFNLFTRRLQQRGLRPLLTNLSEERSANSAIDMLLQYNVDGVIIASSTIPKSFANACLEARLPTVLAFGRLSGNPRVHVIGADDFQGGRLAADLLIAGGYERIGFLGGPTTSTSTQDRLQGFAERLSENGQSLVTTTYSSNYTHENGLRQMLKVIVDGACDSVFCGDDVLAMGALDACREAGVSVPEDMGVIGFNDMDMASWPAYDLTTIRQPIRDIIVSAVELVLGIIEEPERATETRIFQCETVIRGSLRKMRTIAKSA